LRLQLEACSLQPEACSFLWHKIYATMADAFIKSNKTFMKKKFLFPFIAVMVLAACNDDDSSTSTTTTDSSSSTNIDTSTVTAPPPAPLDATDIEFIRKAAMGGKMEVDLGNIAQTNGASDRVKNFGNMMVTDHSNANNELIQFAQSRNVMLNDSVDKKTQDHMTSMQQMKGKSFDKHYMDMMVDDHVKDVKEFEKASTGAKDPDLRAWAAKTLPVLQKHLDSAKAIRPKL
jgi:putative membrane protein